MGFRVEFTSVLHHFFSIASGVSEFDIHCGSKRCSNRLGLVDIRLWPDYLYIIFQRDSIVGFISLF